MRRIAAVAAPALVAGVLLAASLPPWGWWPLAFVGAAILYRRLADLSVRGRLAAGWVAGLGCFVPGLWFTVHFNVYGGIVLMVVESLSMALAAVVVPATGPWRAPAFAGVFTLAEWVRDTWPFGGLPLGGVWLGQAGGPLLVVARLGGPLALSGVVWLGGAGLGALWGRRVVVGTGCVAVVVAVGLAGLISPDGGAPVGSLRVAAVQGGTRTVVLPTTLAASATIRPGSVRLVLWPEDDIAVGPRLAGTRQADEVARAARRLRATLVAGVTEASTSTFRNEAVVWSPEGKIVATYEKVHRVPFGEYIPFRSFFAHLATLQAVPLTAVPGHGSGMVSTPVGRLGLMVSYEVFFADRGRSAVRAGARLLLVPTNTTSYSSGQVPETEVAADQVQAVAEGRDLVQSAPTGYSDIVGRSGRVIVRSARGRRQVVTGTVGLYDGRTVYEVLGDAPVLVVAALALVGGLLGTRQARGGRGRRGRGAAGAEVAAAAAPRRRLSRSNRSGCTRRARLRRRTWRG